MILKTRITNKTKTERTFAWANISIMPGKHVDMEGAYPTACKQPGLANRMKCDIEAGLCYVELITDLPVLRIETNVTLTPVPATLSPVAVTPRVEVVTSPVVETKVKPTEVMKDVTQTHVRNQVTDESERETVFHEGKSEILKPVLEYLTPADKETLRQPETVEMFTGDSKHTSDEGVTSRDQVFSSTKDPLQRIGQESMTSVTSQSSADKPLEQVKSNLPKRAGRPSKQAFSK